MHASRRLRGDPLPEYSSQTMARNLAVFAFAFAGVAAVPVIGWGITTIALTPGEFHGAPRQDRPDVIVLLLDAYPRSDSLMDQFDFDNAPFEAELRERAFCWRR